MAFLGMGRSIGLDGSGGLREGRPFTAGALEGLSMNREREGEGDVRPGNPEICCVGPGDVRPPGFRSSSGTVKLALDSTGDEDGESLGKRRAAEAGEGMLASLPVVKGTDSPADLGADGPTGAGRVPPSLIASYRSTMSDIEDRLPERLARASAAGGDKLDVGETTAVAEVWFSMVVGLETAPMSMD